MGAATASLLTNLFAPPGADMTEQDKQAKERIVASLVAGVAAVTGVGGSTGAVAATNAATTSLDNNWLASEQVVHRGRQRIQVAARIGTSALNLLEGRVVRRVAKDTAGACDAGLDRRTLRQPKVEQDDLAAIG